MQCPKDKGARALTIASDTFQKSEIHTVFLIRLGASSGTEGLQPGHTIYPGSDFEIARAMPPKPCVAPVKLTAAQLAEIDVIDLCGSSSEDEAVADPRAPLEPLVEPLRLQPAHCADEATPGLVGEITYFQ